MFVKIIELEFTKKLTERIEADTGLIQVLLGPRQVGKTTSVLHYFKNSYVGFYQYHSADDLSGDQAFWLEQVWIEGRESNHFVIVDEIQKVEGWSEVVKRLYDEDKKRNIKTKVLLLGSSSLDIQKGLSESLTGRFQLIYAHHWNSLESETGYSINLENFYLFGGYPGSYQFIEQEQEFVEFLKKSIIDTVIEKDILRNHTVKSPALFRQVFDIVTSYPAQEISYNKLLGQIQDKGNIDLVKNYLRLYEGAFLIKTLFKFSGKQIKVKTSSPKIIPLAPVFYYLNIQDKLRADERGRVFEAMIGALLVRMPVEIYYWREGKYEVDYVIKKGRHLVAIEVKSGRRRSERGLAEFCKIYPKAKPFIVSPEDLRDIELQGLKYFVNP